MVSSTSIVNLIYGEMASVTLNTDEGPRDFVYPKSGNVEHHIKTILSGNEYPLPQLDGYAPRIFIDIGANVGATAVNWALNNPAAKIVCFEPSPRNFEVLERNVAGLRNVECHAYGLAAEDGSAELYIGNSQCMQNSLFPNAGTTDESETCVLKRADKSLKPHLKKSGAVLKIDTEGAEVPILKSIAGALDNVDWAYLEYHSEPDRLEIDALMTEKFVLMRSRSNWPHLGTNLYISRRLMARFPELGAVEIERA